MPRKIVSGQTFGGTDQPSLDKKLGEVGQLDVVEPDEHRRKAVEVRGGEVHVGIVRDQGLLGPHIGNVRTENRTVGSGSPKSSQVGPPQRALPDKALRPHPPLPKTLPARLLIRLRQRLSNPLYVLPRGHAAHPRTAQLASAMTRGPGSSHRAPTTRASPCPGRWIESRMDPAIESASRRNRVLRPGRPLPIWLNHRRCSVGIPSAYSPDTSSPHRSITWNGARVT